MAIQTPRRGNSPNVALASGELYPNGVDISQANPDIQATVRPGGWLFKPTPGYPSVRIGTHKIDLSHPQGQSIHFTPLRLAEDPTPSHQTASGPPVMVDAAKASQTTDLADVPGSEYLDDEGKLPGYLAAQNRGPYMSDSEGWVHPGDVPRHGGNTPRDMGDRDVSHLASRAFYDRLAKNPNLVLREEWRHDPVITTLWAVVVVGGAAMLFGNIEKAFRGRNRPRGVAATVGAAPAAAAAGTGSTVADATEAANKSLTAAGEAVSTAVSAAGDAVEAAGDAVEKTGEAAAEAADGE